MNRISRVVLVVAATLAVGLVAAGFGHAGILIDNGTPGYTTSGWSEQAGVADAFNSNQGYNSAAGNTGAYADYAFSGLTAGEQYRVFATWRQAGQTNVSSAVPYTISDGGGVVVVNQQSSAGPAGNYLLADTNGSGTAYFEFQHLATVTEGGDGSVSVRINGPSTGNYALSDAVLVAAVPTNVTIIDNGGLGYAQTAFTNQASGTAFNSTQAYNSSANNGGFATWTFGSLDQGWYEVFATWDQDGQANLATAAPYTVSDGGGLITVNQELAPSMDLILDDTNGSGLGFFNFQRLAEVLVVDGVLTVRLDAVAGGGAGDFVFADAVAIRQTSSVVPEPLSMAIWSLLAGLGVVLRRRRRAG